MPEKRNKQKKKLSQMPCPYPPLLFLFLFLLPLATSKTADDKVLLRGDQTILSANKIFRLGFFSTTNGKISPPSPTLSPLPSSGWYLGIWYASIPIPTYVWVANRNRPLSDPGSSSLELTADGNLAVKDSRNGIVWRTENEEPGTDFRFLETGNLVLVRDGLKVWQSFDHPTDTWLPGMNVTGQTLLTSWRTLFDPSSGFYTLRLNPLGFNEFQLVYNGTVPYWSSGNWTGDLFTGVPEMTVPYIYRFNFANPYKPTASFWYTVMPLDAAHEPQLTRFQVDAEGRLKQYTWEPQTQSWSMFWLQPDDRCRVYGLCGELGFCQCGLLKPCICIPGFRPMDVGAWSSGDYSGGCLRETGDSCNRKDRFDSVGDLRYDGEAQTSAVRGNMSFCERFCLGDCSCVGFFHDEKLNLCKIILQQPLNLKNSSSWMGSNGEILYIRVPKGKPTKKNVSRSIIVLCSVFGSISILGLTLLLSLGWLKRSRNRKKKTTEDEAEFAVLYLKVFSYKELQSATLDFSDKLGHGGFGAVFKGTLPDSSIVAVKRLERPGSGEREFRAEVCTIGNIQHVNLVRLRGFCSENSHRMLVYDYMPNGPLSSYLCRTSPALLSWDVRFRIALGTAKGIAYLHEGCRDCIIHCDIKPENILLDADFTAKVSDFGLAKLVGRDFSRVLATMRGTWGYVAPEWISGLPITTKADVYSFGMTLLELIGGRRNVIFNSDTTGDKEETETETQKWFFPPWAAREVIGGNVGKVVDGRLNGEYDVEEARRVAMVAIWCIQDSEEMRPAMGTVVKMLEGVVEVAVPPPPKLIQALVSGDSYRGRKSDGGSNFNTGLSSAGSRSSCTKPLSPDEF
ncbi:PREDICTED: G-type lectin S-receptor-like serine/threonine-protein kinase SD2-2 [Tarenaya hassleriana]|uniref:G-type lectin S-receptor-like serine/threonine-protein kinase SD2-2 n=1 Tax=Tarenaya hassleriana TaxID=28532 RepID=UPI00053C7C1C|nr:PREDICTED: G-type lectin S-receptor-like serine/threonine-protein kinase SD2-2 [Tarenaya hassleriana]